MQKQWNTASIIDDLHRLGGFINFIMPVRKKEMGRKFREAEQNNRILKCNYFRN